MIQTRKQRNQARARVVAAFRRLAHGVEAAMAHARSVQFYRATGHAWTRPLAGPGNPPIAFAAGDVSGLYPV